MNSPDTLSSKQPVITIQVHLHTILQRQTAEGLVGHLQLELPTGSTLADLLDQLAIDLSPEHLLLVINGRVAYLEQTLRHDDQVNLMPAISGGSCWYKNSQEGKP